MIPYRCYGRLLCANIFLVNCIIFGFCRSIYFKLFGRYTINLSLKIGHFLFIAFACLLLLWWFMMARLSSDTHMVWIFTLSLLWVSNLSFRRLQLFFMCFGILLSFLRLSLILIVWLKESMVLLLVKEFSEIVMVDTLEVSVKALVTTIIFFFYDIIGCYYWRRIGFWTRLAQSLVGKWFY